MENNKGTYSHGGQARNDDIDAKFKINKFDNTTTQVHQLFARLTQEIEEKKPKSVIFFIVDFLCKNYAEHLRGFASIWNGDPDLERERLDVVEFFKAQKISTDIASNFTNAGFDTLETLLTLTAESLDDIEKFNRVRWLPGHKIRLQQLFSDIGNRVKTFREEKELVLKAFTMDYCHHPTAIARTSLLASSYGSGNCCSNASFCCQRSISPSSHPYCSSTTNAVYTTYPYVYSTSQNDNYYYNVPNYNEYVIPPISTTAITTHKNRH